MKVIGITGSFGTGKTFVASIFRSLGAKVIDADKVAHEVIAKGTAACKKIISEFDKGILDKRGNIDRAKLAKTAFAKKTSLAKLNEIVHPLVIRSIRDKIRRYAPNDVIVIDAPLLIEAGLTGVVDKLIVVAASKENQVERCMSKFNISRGDVLKRIRYQMSLKKKVMLADFVIDNDGTRSETRREARKVWKEIIWK